MNKRKHHNRIDGSSTTPLNQCWTARAHNAYNIRNTISKNLQDHKFGWQSHYRCRGSHSSATCTHNKITCRKCWKCCKWSESVTSILFTESLIRISNSSCCAFPYPFIAEKAWDVVSCTSIHTYMRLLLLSIVLPPPCLWTLNTECLTLKYCMAFSL